MAATDSAPDAPTRILDRLVRPLPVGAYVAGAAFLAVSAVFGGGMLVLDPTGASMELPLSWLEGTPFNDYLVPGLVLLGVLGLGSFVTVYGILRRTDWAWHAAVGLGLALVTWIVVQIALIRLFHWLHVLYGGLGLLLVGLALAPAVRDRLRG